MSHDVVHVPEVTFVLERIAKGYYGDELRDRKASERKLAKLLLGFGDYGGSADLMDLLVKDMVAEYASFSVLDMLPHLKMLTSRCESAKTINTLTLIPEVCGPPWVDITPIGHSILASLCRYRARGLVELGEYDEARELFKRWDPNDISLPEFVPQCTKWLEGRVEEVTPTPGWRPCNCDVEPPKWREGCGCTPEIDKHVDPVAPTVPNPSLPDCDPEPSEDPGGVTQWDEPCPRDP
jgi:hypothetical protein